MAHLCSENKGADQLRGKHAADPFVFVFAYSVKESGFLMSRLNSYRDILLILLSVFSNQEQTLCLNIYFIKETKVNMVYKN